MAVVVFGYPILISIGFMMLFVHFSLVLVSTEKIYQTCKTVLNHISKHLLVHQKILHQVSLFEAIFSVFGNVVKHTLSCLIYLKKISKLSFLSPQAIPNYFY